MNAASRVVFLLMDGARPDVLRFLLERGDLPHLARHVLERGSLRTGTTVFPSTTTVAYVPFLLGRYPGSVNLPGVRWLDRATAGGGFADQWRAARSYCGPQAGMVNADIGEAPTMFSLVRESLAVCSPVTRGLGAGAHLIPLRRALIGSLAHYAGRFYRAFDDAVAGAWVGAAARPWRFLFVVFPGIDGAAHLTDPWHPSVLEGYRRVDRALGAFLARANGRGERPLVIVSADHGFSAVHAHWDVAEALEAIGLPTLRHPVHVWRRGARAAVMVSGNACAYVYLEPRSGRSEPRTAAGLPAGLLDWLRAQPAVELAAWRDGEGGVLVARGGGLARLTGRGESLAYTPLSGDPLRLGGALRGADRDVLLRSRATPYPDAPRQLLQLFAAPRAGDIVLAAARGWDFRGRWEIPEHRAGHGSLIREQMEVPVATSIPLGPAPVRTVDLMPLMLVHLGIAVPDGVEGVAPRTGATERVAA